MSNSNNDTMRPDYPQDLIRGGERGKYAARYRQGTNLIWLEPEIAEHFADSSAVNAALRSYLAGLETA